MLELCAQYEKTHIATIRRQRRKKKKQAEQATPKNMAKHWGGKKNKSEIQMQ
jgi:hypothetical protein